ncbi:MAG: hypothetical protein DYG89_44155 [Caldilinea sp. CFX5]|nr:hypothetical protein [Caldilinea sp. CFX5]
MDEASIPEQLLPGDTFRLRGTAEGGARVRVAVNNRVVAGAVAGPQGSWRTTVGFARSGEYTLTVQLVQDDAVVAETEPIFLTVLEPTPTATNTPEPTATNTPEPTATDTPEPTATNTPEPTATDTPEPTATNTPEPTATDTPEPTATNTPEPTATDTPEPTATNTPEPTATDTPEPTATNTPEPTATNTPEPTATNTPEPTATNTPTPAAPVVDEASIPEQLLPGDTFRLRGTADGGARVRVSVNNRVVAGAVAGPQGSWRTTVGFARSGEYTVTVQLVQDDAVVAESEPIFLTVLEPTPTATNTPEPTATNTPEPTATNTPEPTATNTPEPTATNTPEPTATNTPEPTATPVPTPTNTPEPTATPTPEPTATNTPEPTATNTPTPAATNTPTPAAPVVDTASIPDQLLPGDTFRLRGTADGGARVRVAINNRVVAGAVAGPQGSWRTTVGFARSGEYTLTVQLVQDDVAVAESEPIFLTVLEPTPTPEPTATNTPEPTATNTPEPTATNTPEPTATNTPEPTATNTPEPTATNTPEPTATNTPEPTATNTPEPTATNTIEPTATETPTAAPPVVDLGSIPEQLLPGDTFRLRGTADGGARVQVAVNNRVVAGAVAGPQGSWRTTIGFARSGTYTLTVQVLQNEAVAAQTEPIFLTVLEPTPTTEPTPTAVLEPTATAATPVDSSQTITGAAPVDASQPVTTTAAAPSDLPGTGSDFSGGVPWVVLILLLGAAVTLGMGRLSNKPTA